MTESNDSPVRQTLKIVELLECVPGHATHPDGPPITILTLGHLGEVEQPLLLTVEDTQKLVVDLLISLAHHGDDFAEGLLHKHFRDNEYVPEDGRREMDLAPAPKTTLSAATSDPLPTTGKVLIVQFADGRPTIRLSVLQAYQSERGTMFIYRKRTSNTCVEAVALVMGNTIELCAVGDDVLDEKYWADFTAVMPNIEFTFG